MFTPQYAGNLLVAILFLVAIIIIQVVQSVAALPGGVNDLLNILAIVSALGIVVFLGAAALHRRPRLDWSDETGERLHPRAKAGLQTMGVLGIGLGALAFYVAVYVFQWPIIIVPMVLLAVLMLAFIVYLTAGKHVGT